MPTLIFASMYFAHVRMVRKSCLNGSAEKPLKGKVECLKCHVMQFNLLEAHTCQIFGQIPAFFNYWIHTFTCDWGMT